MPFQTGLTNFSFTPGAGSSLLADRPPFGIEGRLWVTTDANPNTWWRDSGTAWVRIGADTTGLVPSTRTLTIGGIAQDLSEDRTWSNLLINGGNSVLAQMGTTGNAAAELITNGIVRLRANTTANGGGITIISGLSMAAGNITMAASNGTGTYWGAAGSQDKLIWKAAGSWVFENNGATVQYLAIAPTGIKTVTPGGAGVGEWRLGKRVSGAVVVDPNLHVEVMIDGTLTKLAVCT